MFQITDKKCFKINFTIIHLKSQSQMKSSMSIVLLGLCVEDETIQHCPFFCNRAVDVSSKCFSLQGNFCNWGDWVREQVDSRGTLLLCVIQKLWCSRNRLVFKGDVMSSYNVALQAHVLYCDIQFAYWSIDTICLEFLFEASLVRVVPRTLLMLTSCLFCMVFQSVVILDFRSMSSKHATQIRYML